MKKSEKILLVILAISVAIYLLDMFVFSKKESAPVVKKPGVVQKNVAGGNAGKMESFWSKQKNSGQNARLIMAGASLDKTIFMQWKRDPFLGAFRRDLLDSLRGIQRKEGSPFVLKAISWRGNVPYVIINEDIYQKGESRNGLTVLDVIGEKVYCLHNGKKFILTLGE